MAKKPTDRLDALVQALVLSVTASTNEKTDKAIRLANQIAVGMSEVEVQRAKKAAETLLESGANLRAARDQLDEAMDAAQNAALDAVSRGATEVDVAQALGVNRLTVRRWLGK